MNETNTDWTTYYQQPALFSRFSRRVTEKFLIEQFSNYAADRKVEILEFGGGNSCFANSICDAIPVLEYAIADNNALGVELFQKRPSPEGTMFTAEKTNLLNQTPFNGRRFDIVYSVGLIEHFQGDALNAIVDRHFESCTDSGLVVITFPTPTFLYRIIRGIAELLGVWKFPDEFPLKIDDVVQLTPKDEFELKYTGINWGVLLTQGVCVWTHK
ncbi:MAG: class I SAM-dependent methyltransferase [Verrucomicrobiales bacterium]|nr:class I SAM-dependent methyltransferase [Verrucomicrobiales bacterium]